MTTRMRPFAIVPLVLLGALSLSGCASLVPQGSTPPTVTVTQTAPASTPEAAPPVEPSAVPTPEVPACSGLTQAEAVNASIDSIAPYPNLESHVWVAATPDDLTYDECADLSYVVVTLYGGTVSTPCHVMLFNQGRYLGTATADAQGYYPRVERLDDASIQVTYTYNLPGESNAAASGRSTATFTWDEATQSVIMEGDVPPTS